jgi:MOSC domain-containing protein
VISVSRLSISPVKSLGLMHPEIVRLETFGVADNRRFLLLDPEGGMFDVKRHASLMRLGSSCDAEGSRLAITFPDGAEVEADVELEGPPFAVDLWGRDVEARLVAGPWPSALSEYVGAPILLARTERPGDGNDEYPASIVANASVRELGRQAGARETPDAGRFRMLLELEGCEPHEEDRWIGRSVRAGGALLRVTEHDARCAVTTMNPESGQVDFPTLKTIAAYRGVKDGQLRFGVYAKVEEPGEIRVGDTVEPAAG